MPDLTPVTVIGLGPMGQAMARSYLDRGHPTTVFNRTASRADALVAAGAVRAESAAAALAASPIVIISLTHYQAMYDLLGAETDRLAGKILVNLSSDTPSASIKAAAWAAEHGATFLTGGVMVNPPLVGQEGSYVFYSGPSEVVERHRETLAVLGRVNYRGEAPELAQVWYQAMLDLFMTILASTTHAAALLGSAGVPAKDFFPYAEELIGQMPYFMQGMETEISERSYPDPGGNTAMMAAGMEHITDASIEAGIDPGLPAAVRDLYRRAVAAGRGAESSTVLYELIVDPTA
ncbi:NAD(P)-dependent oxidoreductase [Microlunatus speluncae]|uniref:NAD(P)-dependent oxidoreductase n=1 Tax=Microlunatus speluncae TaxID=2594267 RepID=UPI00126613E0|nr:NAD(P)-binding domain-containing protein [Microlunatus speluncae]